MKINILFSLLLLAAGVAAQEKSMLTDNLFPDKAELVMQYFPASRDGFDYAVFQLQPDEFLARLDRYKKAAWQKAQTLPSPKLMMGDVDAHSVMLLENYIRNFGIDSAKQAYFYSLLRNEDQNAVPREDIEKAEQAMQVQKLSVADSTKLHTLARKKLDYNNTTLFKRSAAFRRILENQVMYKLYREHAQALENGEQEGLLKMAVVKQMTANQFIRDYYAFDVMETLVTRTKDTVVVKKIYGMLQPQVKEPYYLNSMAKSYRNFVTYADGNPAPDFTYNDVNGKPVSLTDLRGKYVYIDLWATWCGPCKAEIPPLTKIEERLQDKMHFVSISLDKVASYNSWKSYVINNKLKGIQLMVDKDFKSGFIECFNVTFIPRFILIDPEGRIKDGNAKRPSDPALVEELEALLAAGGK